MRSNNRSEEEYRVAGDGSNGSDRGETLDRSRGAWPSATEVAAMTVNIIIVLKRIKNKEGETIRQVESISRLEGFENNKYIITKIA